MILLFSGILFLCGVSMLTVLILFEDYLNVKSEGNLLVLTAVTFITSLLLLGAEIITSLLGAK